MTRWRIAAAAVALALAACSSAGMDRARTYPISRSPLKAAIWESAHVRELAVGNKVFAMWFHPTEPTLLIARRSIAGVGVALAEGYGFAGAVADGPEPQWRAGANFILSPLGCEVTDLYPLQSPYWEAVYRCENGQPVSADVIEQNRAAWRQRREITYP